MRQGRLWIGVHQTLVCTIFVLPLMPLLLCLLTLKRGYDTPLTLPPPALPCLPLQVTPAPGKLAGGAAGLAQGATRSMAGLVLDAVGTVRRASSHRGSGAGAEGAGVCAETAAAAGMPQEGSTSCSMEAAAASTGPQAGGSAAPGGPAAPAGMTGRPAAAAAAAAPAAGEAPPAEAAGAGGSVLRCVRCARWGPSREARRQAVRNAAACVAGWHQLATSLPPRFWVPTEVCNLRAQSG